jgi:hypothetical protein
MLNQMVQVIVPSKTKNNKQLNLQDNANECLLAMIKLFGGATASYIQNGGFVMSNGEIMLENSITVWAFCDAEKDLKEFFDFCLSIKAKYEQECIAIVINNSMQFI